MAKWMVAAKKADFDDIAHKFQITPVLARILRNRDLIEEEDIRKFLNGELSDLHNPLLMKGMEKAVHIILDKIRTGASIRIIGDYDVDGICASYILLRGLKALGGNADVVIPHRQKDGYGLSRGLIEAAKAAGIDTIITCDNGIAAVEQIRLAKELGITVVITDHHEVPYEEEAGCKKYVLPVADAVVDPKQSECQYPCKLICGAVVAYKFVQTLLQMAEEPMKGEQEKSFFEELLTFAALATVCDVMELRDENRIIVKKGLSLMEQTTNIGLKALLQACGIDGKKLSPYHMGFVLGPCLNATGRLDTATRALALFQAREWREAVTIAEDLRNLNENRKLMTEEGVKQAVKLVEDTPIGKDKVLVIFLPDCHESLAGIIAGRMREKYGKPTFVLTASEEGVKGSGRSIPPYSMYEEISACRELFTKYGGHRMAAGISLSDEKDIEKLRKLLNKNCQLTEEDLEETVHIDVPMPLSYIDKAFVEELSLLEPFGVGNAKPLFARKNISLLSGKKMGKSRNVGRYLIADERGNTYQMIYFGDLEGLDNFLTEKYGVEKTDALYGQKVPLGEIQICMAYYPEINSFGGHDSIQIVMQSYC